MEKSLIRYFWNCGDNDIIELAILRSRLNRIEKDVLRYMLDECYSQEKTAELMDLSTRNVQKIWAKATSKLLSIDWVRAYAISLKDRG